MVKVKHDSENKEQTIASSNTEKTRDIEFKENQCIDVQGMINIDILNF
jgi:hypothetical protein